MPRIDAFLDRLGDATFVTKLDMTKAYFQVGYQLLLNMFI